jgi:Na+-driven multidrug efflux pump
MEMHISPHLQDAFKGRRRKLEAGFETLKVLSGLLSIVITMLSHQVLEWWHGFLHTRRSRVFAVAGEAGSG